jgi:N-methylhydantoinase A/oxoprolinase/acetone carboxylase beta subunit
VSVGPRSAGSDPGPACYERGGLRPTVTDADLLLGYLDPDRYADGRIPLNVKRAVFAIEEEFGDYLDLEPVEIAKLNGAEVDEQMAAGMAKELRTRGYLPHEFTMLAYGGNGPLHACGIVDHLSLDRVLAPPYSLGLLRTWRRHLKLRYTSGRWASSQPAFLWVTDPARSGNWIVRPIDTVCSGTVAVTSCQACSTSARNGSRAAHGHGHGVGLVEGRPFELP